jgi:alanine racemase
MDMVRFGIALYGFWPSRETRIRHFLGTEGKSPVHQRDPLRRILRMKSKVMSTKIVTPGEFVGYGNSYQTAKRERVAAVPVGYSTGFARSLSNIGYVLIRGRRCNVTGIVIGDVQKGEEVVIIGKQGRSCITVASFSDITSNLNYELLVRLPSEIPRMIVD